MFGSTLWSRVLPFEAFNRDLKLIFVSNFIGALGDGLYVYLLPLFIRGLQATSADVGFLFSILTLSTALTIIPGGFLADRFDRKKVMILGWAVWVPLPLMFSVATHWTQLVPAMILYGFFLSGPATSAYVMTAAKKGRVTITYTTLGASWWLGYIFSPGLGGYLSTVIGMQSVFFIAFILYVAATAMLFLIQGQRVEKSVISQTARSDLISSHTRKIVLLSLFFAVVFFFLSLVRPLVVQFFQDVYIFESFQIGLLGSMGFFGSAVFSIVLGKVGDKLGKMVAAATALLVGAFALVLFTSFNNFLVLVFASLYGASFMLWALMGACVGAFTPEASRGRWISLSQMLATAAASAAPFIGGVLYGWSPYMPFYILAGVSPLLALIALIKPFKEEKAS
jgi:MFS family permease